MPRTSSGASKRRSTPFQAAHAREFGLRVVSRDDGGDVDSVECLACVHIGRQIAPAVDPSTRKRKATERNQIWRWPFRKENFRSHLEGQHPLFWEKYRVLSAAQKDNYFVDFSAGRIGSYFETDRDSVVMYANATIVENVIGDLFFRVVEGEDGMVEVSKERALGVFKKDPVPCPGGGERYSAEVKGKVRFNLALKDVSAGMSFRLAATANENAREETSNPKLGGLSPDLVSDYVRMMFASNLQVISDILEARKTWAFSVAGDGSNVNGVPLFDIRVRLMVGAKLMNLHLLLVPFYDRHTAVNTCTLVCTVFDALHPIWRDTMLSVGTDGENTMTGRHGGFATLLEAEANNRLLRFWCGSHQMDLAVQKTTKEADGGEFYETAHEFSVHLRIQERLISDMGSKCPRDTTRWRAFGNMLKWILDNRRRLLLHLETRPERAPSPSWWIIAAGFQSGLEIVAFTFMSLEKHEITVCQQRKEIADLVEKLSELVGLHLMLEYEAYEDLSPLSYYSRDTSEAGDGVWVRYSDVELLLQDCGSWVTNELAKLTSRKRKEVITVVATFFVDLVLRLSDVTAERDSENRPKVEEHPPVYPFELASMRTAAFISDVLDPFRSHISKHWTDEEVDQVERDHKALVTAVKTDRNLKEKLLRHTRKTMWIDAWDDCGGRFSELRLFAGGLATAFPNTTSVESDFSITNFEYNGRREGMSNLSLGGIMQSKQRRKLLKLKV